MSTKSKLEYIWLDGYKPTQSLRSKTRIESDFGGTLEECPMWSFDGSSTEQATGGDSDCLLKPVAIFPDPGRKNGFLVMTEVLNADGSPHESNGRATIADDDEDFWFGFEQEYFLWCTANNNPPGFPLGGYPSPQGPYYCSVGASNAHGRACVDEHLDACLDAGINVRASMLKLLPANGNFRYSPRVRNEQAMKSGLHGICLNASERNTDMLLIGIRSHLEKPTGTDLACMPISQMRLCVRAVIKKSSPVFVKGSVVLLKSTSPFMVPTTTNA